MQRASILLVIIGAFSAFSIRADEYIASKSPDGKFALRVRREDKQPFQQNTAIVDSKSKKVILDLDTDHLFDPEAKLVWSSDSQWVAYWTWTDESTRSSSTRVFVRTDAGFDEIKLSALPPPKVSGSPSPSEKEGVRLKPIRWSKPGLLDLESETIFESGWRGALHLSLQLDQQHQVSIIKAEPEPMSIVDYYLLLPADQFEAPAIAWLDHHAEVVDKQNGYLSIGGDGAQPSFEVALFRYRDGRPLLALCEGKLEGDNSVGLKFFELGADGRMQEVPRKIFPIGDFWMSDEGNPKYADFRFELPRHGRTVVVRSLKTKKILHRVTWNGEKFIEEKP